MQKIFRNLLHPTPPPQKWLELMNEFQIGKRVHQGCILSPYLLNLHAEYIMRNAGLDEAQAGIKIAERNSEEELKSLLIKAKEESEKVGLKLHIQKTKIMAAGPITLWQIDGEMMEIVADFILVTAAMKLKDTCSLEGKLWPT